MSMPNKPYEYMAAGLPLLSSLPGELERLVAAEGIGLHYESSSAPQLAERVAWLADHPEERARMAGSSRMLFEARFRSDRVYPDLVRHIEAIAGTTAQPGGATRGNL